MTTGYYAKGHENKESFCEAVKDYYGHDIDLQKVEYKFFRIVPHSEFGKLLHDSKKGKGAFPVTVVDIY